VSDSAHSRHEAELKRLAAQISFLDEEIAARRRRLADSRRHVQILEDKLQFKFSMSL
jgi:flagellar biosynthesis chaperone FliJ